MLALTTNPPIDSMTRSNHATLNGTRQVTLSIMVPSGYKEIVVQCTAVRNVHDKEDQSALLMIQGERNDNLPADRSKKSV